MPAQRPQPPATRARQTAPVSTDFATRQIVDAAQRAADQVKDRTVTVLNLVVGDNVINHGLGRRPTGATVTPTVADATWAWAIKAPSATQVTITCIGVAQPGAAVEVY